MAYKEPNSPRGVIVLPAALLVVSVVLRAALSYQDSSQLTIVLGYLGVWLVLLALEPFLSRRLPWFFAAYLPVQILTPLLLMSSATLGYPDYFAVLYAILSMQAMQRLPARSGMAIIFLLGALPMVPLMSKTNPGQAVGYVLVYFVANALLGFFALADRRACEAQSRNKRLVEELEDANRRLRDSASRREQLATARARHELARELHDSVTQTAFSMSLATESALLMLDGDPGRVGAQIDHVSRLAQSAMTQMQTLISELRPDAPAETGLVEALRKHLAERSIPECLAVSVEVEGDDSLQLKEQRGLFSIAREAINNILKHAEASSACIRLHLSVPYEMEVVDNGRGFDATAGQVGGGIGMIGMREQAAEIGWLFAINSAPGEGTQIRVTKPG